METPVNEHILKLTGKASLPLALTMSKTYEVVLKGDITKTSDVDNQNGTINREYRFEPHHVEIVNDKGARIVGKDTSKTSQKIRSRHHIWTIDNASQLDYEWMGRQLVAHYDEVMELLKKLC